MADKNLVVKKGIEVSETGSFGGNLSTLGNLTVSGTVSGVTKAMVGLSDVDNTTDANKSISTATQTALNTKVSKVTSTDNALVRFDGTTGDVQNSLVTVDDGGCIYSKRWTTEDVPAGYYCPIMSFSAGSWGAVTSGTLTVNNTSSGRVTTKVYAVNLMGEGHYSSHLTLLSQTDYANACPFDVYTGFTALGGGSDIIYFLNRDNLAAVVTFTYSADVGAPTTYYTNQTATYTGLTSFFTPNTASNTLSELHKATFGSAVMRLRTEDIMEMESGRVLIGKTTDDGVSKLQVQGGASVSGNVGIGTANNPSLSRLIVKGNSVGTSYNSTFVQADATLQIIGDEMSANKWYPTFNITMVRQSLGVAAFGGIGFSTIDDSNAYGMYDAARIAIINDDLYLIESGTSMAFYTQVGIGGINNTSDPNRPATERMRINSVGNVGIGTTTPTEKLHVAGNILAAGYKTTDSNNVEKTGVTDSFTSADGKTITVTNGLITSIV